MFLACSTISLVLLQALWVQPVFADHESRDRVLSESGVEVLLIVLVLGAAIAAMVTFAAAILWWERQGEEQSEHEEPR
jgi:hypothetical protein